MTYSSTDLRVFTGNGRDELEVTGPISASNIIAVCERVTERLQARRGRGSQEVYLDLSGKRMDAVCVGKVLQCFSDNSVCLKSLRLVDNSLTDFDLRFGLGAYIQSPAGRFLTDIDLSQNSIGDFGCLCLLQLLIDARSRNQMERKITVVRIRDNLISHPGSIVDAIPEALRILVSVPGITGEQPPNQILVHMVGMDQQRSGRARRDMPQQIKIPITRPIRAGTVPVEPDDADW